MSEGIAAELHGIDLRDERLNKRSQHIIEALAAKPQPVVDCFGAETVHRRPKFEPSDRNNHASRAQASVNAASEGWADTVAA